MAQGIRDKNIWITGGTAGIGKAMAMECAKRGASLVLTARREELLRSTAQDCLVAGAAKVQFYVLDMADEAAIFSTAQRVLAEMGRIDILINNAGISQRSLVKDTDMSVYRKIMEVDYFGAIALAKALLPGFLNQGQGQIVVISSLVGKFATPLRSGYSAAKHALHGFFDALRAEHYDDNLRVTMICPGFIKTDISVNAMTGSGEPQNKLDQAQANGMEPAKFAQIAIDAVEKEKEEICIGGKEKNGVLLSRLLPSFFRSYIRKAAVT